MILDLNIIIGGNLENTIRTTQFQYYTEFPMGNTLPGNNCFRNYDCISGGSVA